ncbi:cellulose-binding domain-containing protein [Streptomyces hyaluromycini]|uniref:cellulose-binding domain-containing protein n=1 Tax=Streptomyces hyaluromycini TaxID=1377993 RepID=UPI000B5C8086|nr:cellulose-binding domain-containing protein [Streptomyces hyaluromycini]
MPDLPTPQDAAEAALFSECWDAVLSYADLCTSGSLTANQLATEAFTLGMREAREADFAPVRSSGRRAARLPMIPLLLTAVRNTAAAWEAEGLGHQLDPDLRLWLNSEKAARYTGLPLQRPVALRGLRDMQEADAELLWLAEVEALPLSSVARRLGLDPVVVAQELEQVRVLFRDRCHRAHLDTPMAAECRSYARLLDAVTRSSSADTPEDLSRHLATCVQCAEAAACLRLHGGGLPAALAGGVIGWGGLAYLERRRRAAEVRLGAGRPVTADHDGGDPKEGSGRGKVLRHGLLGAAVMISLVALGVSMMPMGGGSGDDAASASQDDRQPVADPGSVVPSADPTPTHTASAVPSASATAAGSAGHKNPDPEPQGTSSATASTGGHHATASATPTPSAAAPDCQVSYDLVNQWTDGFQSTVTVTTTQALSGWRVQWSFRDGQKVTQMWDATVSQNGGVVTADAANYNQSVAANGTLSFGFLGTWSGQNSAPYAFTLNGESCSSS